MQVSECAHALLPADLEFGLGTMFEESLDGGFLQGFGPGPHHILPHMDPLPWAIAPVNPAQANTLAAIAPTIESRPARTRLPALACLALPSASPRAILAMLQVAEGLVPLQGEVGIRCACVVMGAGTCMSAWACVCVYVCVCVRACARACPRAC